MTTHTQFRKALLASLVAAALVGCSDPKQEAVAMVSAAQDYVTKGDVRAAVIELKNALQSDSTNAQARLLLGQVSLSVGDAASAEKELRHALESGASRDIAQPLLVESLLRQARHDDVLNETEALDEFSAEQKANLLSMRALSLWALKREADAQASLAAAEAASANAPWILQAKVDRALAENRLADAKGLLGQGLTANPTHRDLLLSQAELAQREGKSEERSQALAKIISLEPNGVATEWGWKARLAQAEMLVQAGQLDAAQAAIEPLTKQGGNDPRVNHVAGLIAYRKGDTATAEQKVQAVLKVAPQFPPSLALMGSIQYDKKNYEQAVYNLSQYLTAVPENVEARKLLGRSYLALGRSDEALETLRAGISKSKDPELIALVGLAELERGQGAQGIRDLEQAVAADPENQAFRFALARAHITAGDYARAEKELSALEARDESKVEAQKLRVLAAMRAGKTEQAQKLAQAMVDASPDDAALVAMLASVHLGAGDRATARSLFTRALELKPDYLEVTMDLARVEQLDGDLAQAKAHYEAALKIKPDSVPAMLALARLAETQGDARLATEWLEKTQKAAPADVLPNVALAESYLSSNDLTKAEAVVNQLAQAQPNHPATLAIQGRLYMAKGQNERALAPLQELTKVAPKVPLSYVLLADVLARLDKLDDAYKAANKALELDAKSVPALATLGRIELRRSNFAKAQELGTRLVKVAPDSAVGYELQGDALMAQRQFSEARQAYQAASEREQVERLTGKSAQATFASGQREEAVGQLTAWLETHPQSQRLRLELANYYQQIDRDAEAAVEFEKILEQDPKNIVALNNLAWLYTQRNDPRGVALAKTAHDLSPDNAGIQDTYGWALVQNGKAQEGLPLLEKAAGQLKDIPDVIYHVAVAKFRLGQKDEAKQMLQELVSSDKAFEGREEAQRLLAGAE